MRKWYRITFATIALLLVAAIASFTVPIHVHAADNGQQVLFTINHNSCWRKNNLRTVTITGQNQNGGPPVTWSGPSSDGQSVFVANWWWVGGIHITFNDGVDHTTDAYVPQQTTSDYPHSDAGYVLVTCAGTQMNYKKVITSEGYYWACITRDNPPGHITYYDHWYGYVYTGPLGTISPGGYALGPQGKIVPLDVTDRFTTFECG